MNAVQKRDACFHGNRCNGASAKECGCVLQSETLRFGEVTESGPGSKHGGKLLSS